MENPMLHELAYILDNRFKPRKTPCMGAYFMKHRCAERGLCYYTEEEFIEQMALLGHTPNKHHKFNFSLLKK